MPADERAWYPYDPMCNRFARDMEELDTFWAESQEELDAATPATRASRRELYVVMEEGTLNPVNGHFLCDKCYIKAYMPTAPHGWVCP